MSDRYSSETLWTWQGISKVSEETAAEFDREFGSSFDVKVRGYHTVATAQDFAAYVAYRLDRNDLGNVNVQLVASRFDGTAITKPNGEYAVTVYPKNGHDGRRIFVEESLAFRFEKVIKALTELQNQRVP